MIPAFFNWVKFQENKKPNMVNRAMDIPGWVDHRVPGVLRRYCGQVPDGGIMVNIGTWKGASTVLMSEYGPANCVIWGVDHFRGSPDERKNNHAEAASQPRQVLGQFTAYITELNLWGRIMLLSCDSVAASYYFRNGEIDLIYVDGGHDVESVTQDLINWLPKLKKGGIMLGDDLDWAGVRLALDNMNLHYTEPEADKIWMIKND